VFTADKLEGKRLNWMRHNGSFIHLFTLQCILCF
jgi:hypothetical protein